MDKTIIIVSCLLAFALIMCGCTQGATTAPVQQPAQQPVQPQENVTNTSVQAAPCAGQGVTQRDQCFLAHAQGTSNPDTCKNIYSVATLDSCYALFASDNLGICEKITDQSMLDACLLQNAQSQNSSSICNMINDSQKREGCLTQILPPCMAISDPAGQTLCLALQGSNPSLCANNSACIFAYAKNKSDTNACAMIGSQVDSYACMAVAENSAEACKNAPATSVQDACILEAAELLDNPGACALASPQSSGSNGCYTYFAVKYLNPNYCADTAPQGSSDDCYTNYSIETANSSTCAKVVVPLEQIGCYYKAATDNGMPSLCNPLAQNGSSASGAERVECYSLSTLGAGGPVPSDCQFVNDSSWRDECYYTAAKDTSDSTLCGVSAQARTRTSATSCSESAAELGRKKNEKVETFIPKALPSSCGPWRASLGGSALISATAPATSSFADGASVNSTTAASPGAGAAPRRPPWALGQTSSCSASNAESGVVGSTRRMRSFPCPSGIRG